MLINITQVIISKNKYKFENFLFIIGFISYV